MNKSKKWKIGLLFMGVALLSGCTKSFCTVQDKVNMMYVYETTVNNNGETNLQQIVNTVNETGSYYAPTEAFFNYIEENVAATVVNEYYTYTLTFIENEQEIVKTYQEIGAEALISNQDIRKAFVNTNEYALVKYAKEFSTNINDTWSNFDKWKKEALNKGLTIRDVGSDYFYSQMKNKYNSYTATITACITPVDREFDGLKLEGKSWGDAFKLGLIEGLLVWPISTMLYYFTIGFSSMGWFGTLLAIFLVTLIVRGVLTACTFKQTLSQQRMTDMGPELEALQQKYPNANTNEYEKQMMAQEQMAIYKKNGVNPFGMFIIMIFQFPIFIAVWGAMSGSAILREGQIFGLHLSDNSWNAVTHWQGIPSVVAIIIFVLMSVMQAVSMLLPQYLQKKRNEKNVTKLNKSASKNSTNTQMKIMNYVMLAMIIFMGATLPIAMAIYWFVSALISLTQSLIMSSISQKRSKNSGYVKYKNK